MAAFCLRRAAVPLVARQLGPSSLTNQVRASVGATTSRSFSGASEASQSAAKEGARKEALAFKRSITQGDGEAVEKSSAATNFHIADLQALGLQNVDHDLLARSLAKFDLTMEDLLQFKKDGVWESINASLLSQSTVAQKRNLEPFLPAEVAEVAPEVWTEYDEKKKAPVSKKPVPDGADPMLFFFKNLDREFGIEAKPEMPVAPETAPVVKEVPWWQRNQNPPPGFEVPEIPEEFLSNAEVIEKKIFQAKFEKKLPRGFCVLGGKKTPKPLITDLELLHVFMSDQGRIRPRRKNKVCKQKQAAIANAIKIARHIGLLHHTGRLPEYQVRQNEGDIHDRDFNAFNPDAIPIWDQENDPYEEDKYDDQIFEFEDANGNPIPPPPRAARPQASMQDEIPDDMESWGNGRFSASPRVYSTPPKVGARNAAAFYSAPERRGADEDDDDLPSRRS